MGHFKIVIDILTLVLGSGLAVALFRQRGSLCGGALRALGFFVVFHNVLVLGDLGYRYYLVNITNNDIGLFSTLVMATFVVVRIAADTGSSWFLYFVTRRLGGQEPKRLLLVALLTAGALVFALGLRGINEYNRTGSLTGVVQVLQVWILAVLGLIFCILVMALWSSRNDGLTRERRLLRRLAALLLPAYILILMDELNFYYFRLEGFDPGNLPILAVNLAALVWMLLLPPTSLLDSPTLRISSLEDLAGVFGVSAREMDVIEQLLLGKSNKEIQEALFISSSTVKNHLSSIYRKLGVDSRTRLVATLRPRSEQLIEPQRRD